MLRRSCRWLDTQPRKVPVSRPVFPTKPGSAGCDPTPATAAATRPPDGGVLVESASAKIPPSLMQKATCFRPPISKRRPPGWPSTLATPPPKCDPTPATAAATRPPDGGVVVEAASAKIPPRLMQKATCFPPPISKRRPPGWPSTLATRPPKCDLDVHVGGSYLRPPRSLAVHPDRSSDQGFTSPTSGDISLAGCLKEKEFPPPKDTIFSHPPVQRNKNTPQPIPLTNHDTFDEHTGPYNGSVHSQMKPFGVHGMHFTSIQKSTRSLAVLRARLSEGVTSPASGDIPLPGECLCLKENDQVPPAKGTTFSHPSDQKRNDNTPQTIPLTNHDIFDEHTTPYNGSVHTQMKPFGEHGMDFISSRSRPHCHQMNHSVQAKFFQKVQIKDFLSRSSSQGLAKMILLEQQLPCFQKSGPQTVQAIRSHPHCHQMDHSLQAGFSEHSSDGSFSADHALIQKCSNKLFSAQQCDGSMIPKMVQNWGSRMIEYGIPRRCFSTVPADHNKPLSPPLPPPDNLLEVVWPFTESETNAFYIRVFPAENLIHAVKVDNTVVRDALEPSSLKNVYDQLVRPALLPRGMIFPYQLHDPRTQLVHNRFKRITKQYPIYMTSLDIMVALITTETNKWISLLDDLSKKHIYVIEDWNRRFYTSCGYTIQDYGLRVGPNRGKGYYRGECDASFNQHTGLAKISAIIWLDDQIVCCAVCYDIPCKDSVHAEALAMSYLLKIGAPFKKLEVVSDCEVVINTIKGWKQVGPSDANYDSFMELRFLTTQYEELIPRLETREKLSFADSLLKKISQPKYTLEYVKSMLERWAPPLRGSPVFMVGGHPTRAIMKLASNRIILEEFQNRCYCEVEKDSDKLSALFHIISSLGANDIHLIVNDFETRTELEQQFIKMFGACDISWKDGRRYFLKVPRPALHSYIVPKMRLFVVFDAADARDCLMGDQDIFVVVLSTPNERALMTELNIELFSPISYVSFHRYINANQKGLQITEEQKKEEPSGDLQ